MDIYEDLKYFVCSEFDSPDSENSGHMMDSLLLLKLDSLRHEYGKPIIISSGYRTDEYNKSIGGHPNSYHKKGMAVDLKCHSSSDRYEIVKIALKLGFSGIEICDRHIHLDVRKDKNVMFLGVSK